MIQKAANLLLVDDKPENLLALESILDDLDCTLFKAFSGQEALRLVIKHDFAIALLDVQMPEMNGFELAELIRGRQKTRHLPFIFMTAISKDQRYVFKGYEAGAVDYLFKPIEPEILRSKVKVFLELYNQRQLLTKQAVELERKKSEQEIKYLAYHDVLTGLPNRRSFYMRLEDELVQLSNWNGNDRRRVGPRKRVILFLDLDKFKDINDTMGHETGDDLLKMLADRLRTCVRKSDDVFRLGGDEFTVLLNDLDDVINVVKVAEKIRMVVAQPCRIKDHEIYMTVSIGISLYPDDGKDVETLVKNADMAMYAAKENRGGYRFFTEAMNRKALERMKLESSLRTALQDNQLLVYYQPLVGKNHRLVGMEALLRWHHPEFGLISPAKFIPLAEETGAIIPIGKWVLHTACQQAKRWYEMGHSRLHVAVNLSPRQFQEPDLVEMVEQVLEDVGLPPECLKLEVTESGIMENPAQAAAKMTLLCKQGVHFSIDDFGTGYSSLSYLKQFPIDILKIDRSFVMDAPSNRDDQELIKTIIAMARNLNLDVVAEGVETQEQQDFLTSHGCQTMQGYFFGRPMPPEKFEELLPTK